MAQRNLYGLNNLNQLVRIPCAGQTRVGVGVTGTFVGTLTVYRSFDGANYLNFQATDLQTFPATAGPTTITANGNYFLDALGAQQIVVVVTAYTSGNALVTGAAANDDSWQDAYLASTSKFVSQNTGGGLVNSQTIAGQANRAWRLRSASVSFSTNPAAPVEFQVLDGASSVIWDGFIDPKPLGNSAGGTYAVPLPPPDPARQDSGGVIGTVGNGMTLKLFAPGGSVTSTVNGEMLAA